MPTSAQLLDLALLGKRREIRLLRTDTEYELSDTDISPFRGSIEAAIEHIGSDGGGLALT